MVWHICHFLADWLQPNNIILVGIFIGVALLVLTQISPMEYLSHHVGRLMALAIMASSGIYMGSYLNSQRLGYSNQDTYGQSCSYITRS
jgi:hypothetical protein